jgi:uncharacterized membrane protein
MPLHRHLPTFESVTRIELFSDAVFAIVVTLLVLEIHVPELTSRDTLEVQWAIAGLIPEFLSFILSFVTICVFWVNHHHFFHALKRADSGILWHNNHLLMWICLIPFVTAFVGDEPTIPAVVALYGGILSLAALAFTLMIRHAFFHGELTKADVSARQKRRQLRRSLFGAGAYALSSALALISPWLSILGYIIIPSFFFLPQLLSIAEGE